VAVPLVMAAMIAGAIAAGFAGCYPNPDDLRRGASGGAGRSTTSGGAGKTGSAGATNGGTAGSTSTGPGAGGSGGSKAGTGGGSVVGVAGGSGSGSGGRGGTGGPTTGTAGGTGTGVAGSSGAGVLDATYSKWAAAVCGRDQLCVPSLFGFCWAGDVVGCNARYKLWLKTYVGTYPDFGVTDTTISQCATAISQQSCADYLNAKVLPTCEVPGKRTNGQPCDVGDQCNSIRCSNNANGCGVCAARVAAGGNCVASEECVVPLVCGESGTCVAARQLNTSCATDTLACAPSLRCRGGLCSQPLTQVGAACVGEEDCDTAHGLICDTAGGKCVSWTSSATTCGAGTTWTFCSKGGFCSDEGFCTPAAADGKSCDDTIGPSCLYPATCNASGLCSVSATVHCSPLNGAALNFTEAAPDSLRRAPEGGALQGFIKPPRLGSRAP
jgi:hypothetical protein